MVKVLDQIEPVVRQETTRELISSIWIGAIFGALTWVFTYILSQYVIGKIACSLGSSLVSCTDAVPVAAGVAVVLASIVGLVFLVRERAFRPLLIVLATIVTLWGINGSWLETPTFVTFLATLLLSALGYTVFGWFSRVRNFPVALAITVVLVIVFRIIIAL